MLLEHQLSTDYWHSDTCITSIYFWGQCLRYAWGDMGIFLLSFCSAMGFLHNFHFLPCVEWIIFLNKSAWILFLFKNILTKSARQCFSSWIQPIQPTSCWMPLLVLNQDFHFHSWTQLVYLPGKFMNFLLWWGNCGVGLLCLAVMEERESLD